MESQSQEAAARFDTPLLAIAVLLILGGTFAYYYLDSAFGFGLRVGVLAAVIVIALFIGYQTTIGKGVWATIVGSRVELRKVVWPTRQQSVQLTLLVALVTLLTALFMWAADSLLLFLVKFITGGAG